MSRFVCWPLLALALIPLACSRTAKPKALEFDKPANADDANAAECATLATDNTRFAFDLFRQLPREGNLVVSPFAVSCVTSMALAGARGETAEEMKKGLRLTLADEKLHP